MSRVRTHRWFTRLFVGMLFLLVVLRGRADATRYLEVQGDHFKVNGAAKFLAFVSYFDGLDANNYDAEFRYFGNNGFSGVRIFPDWAVYSGRVRTGRADINCGSSGTSCTLLRPDGALNAARLGRLKTVLQAARNRGLVVDLSFDWELVQGMPSPVNADGNYVNGTFATGLRNVARELKAYDHVLFDLQNELNLHGFRLGTPAGFEPLVAAVRAEDPSRILTGSATGSDPFGLTDFSRRATLGVVSYHDPRAANWVAATNSYVADLRTSRMPVYFQEPWPFDDPAVGEGWTVPADFGSALRNAKSSGAAAWMWHTRAGFDLNSTPEVTFVGNYITVGGVNEDAVRAQVQAAIADRQVTWTSTTPEESVSLTQLMPNQIDEGMASVGLNRSYASIWWAPEPKPLRIGDRTFQGGLGTRANNVISYRLHGRYRRFQAWVGLDAAVLHKPEASVIFKVLGDGRVLFESGVMRPSDVAKRVDVSVERVTELKLVAEDAGDGYESDHADWAEPVLAGIIPREKFSDGKIAHRIRGSGLEVGLDARGYPTELKHTKSGTKYPIDGASELEGCAVTDTQVEKTAQTIRFNRTLSCDARLSETFEPAGDGVRWELEIEITGKARGGHVNTVLRWLQPQSAQIWTAWGRGQQWSDPLPSWDFQTDWYEYGTFFNRSQGVSLPMFTVLNRKHDAAVTVLQNFEDKIIKMNLATDEDGTLQFSRYNLRMGEGKKWRFRVELLPHAADVRAALGAVVARHPNFFDPPNPLAYQLGGHAAYSSSEEDLGPKFHEMGLTHNWKASFDFPYMGMFLPPVRGGETWMSFGGGSTGDVDKSANRSHAVSVSRLADYSTRVRREGYYVLSYFNVTEFGTGIQFPAPPRKAVKDEDLWRDPNDFLHHAIPGAILLRPEPRFTWGKAIVTDCGDPAYRKFLLEQARRHVEELPDASGICIDRMDWLDLDNPRADDGLAWNKGPVRSLLNSWQDLMVEMEPIFIKANKVIFGNPMVRRPDLARYLDGFYDEHGDFGFSINTTSFLALRKPAAMWTRDEKSLEPDPDAFMQKNLYMGVFLTAPVPGNDHCLLPSPQVDKIYMDYGPLFNALRGRKWVLVPHVIETQQPALANVFEVPNGYVVVVGLAGTKRSVPVTLKNLQLKGFRAEAIAPGENVWKVVTVKHTNDGAQVNVPVQRGGAVVRFQRP